MELQPLHPRRSVLAFSSYLKIGLLLAIGTVCNAKGYVPQRESPVDKVDIIEYNQLYNELGKPGLRQVIFWSWKPHLSYIDNHGQLKTGAFVVVEWFRLNDHIRTQKNWKTNKYECNMYDYRSGYMRRVIADTFVRTETHYDPEVLNSRILPRNQRQGLKKKMQKFHINQEN